MTTANLMPVEIVKTDEPWCEVILVNGDIIRYKLVVNQVLQQMSNDGKPLKDDLGSNVYGIRSVTVVQTALKYNKQTS